MADPFTELDDNGLKDVSRIDEIEAMAVEVSYPILCLLIIPRYKPGDSRPEGYLEWHEWAEVQWKAGLRQTRCEGCGNWMFPQEAEDHDGH